ASTAVLRNSRRLQPSPLMSFIFPLYHFGFWILDFRFWIVGQVILDFRFQPEADQPLFLAEPILN
ncbi:MAG: hypothetical protein ACREPG_11175, partial [Candidatus Binatia bacterium]